MATLRRLSPGAAAEEEEAGEGELRKYFEVSAVSSFFFRDN